MMKQNYLFKTLFLLCAVLVGNVVSAADKWVKTAPADLATGDVVVIVDQTSGKAMSHSSLNSKQAPNAVDVTLSDDKSEITFETEGLEWIYTAVENGFNLGVAGTENFLYATADNNGLRIGIGETNVCVIEKNNEVDFITMDDTKSTKRYIGVYNSTDWRSYTSVNANIKNCVTAFYKKTAGEADIRTATTVELSGEYSTTGEVGETLTLPTATVKADDQTLNEATVTWSSSNETVAKIEDGTISLLAAGTATIKAAFAGDNTYQPSQASYTLTVTAPAVTYTSLKALQEAVTSTSTDVTIQFNDVFVTAVKSSNAYLADADGYGVLVYTSNHGLEAGQVLNGTINAKLVLYRGQTEIMDFSSEGLTITTTELTPTEKNINQITAANQSTLVTLKGVTFSDGKLSDGTNEITYYDNFSAGSLVEGKTYDITGIVILYNTTIEIAPRTADDIVEVQADDNRTDCEMLFVEDDYKTEGEAGTSIALPTAYISDGTLEVTGDIKWISSDETVATIDVEKGVVNLLKAGTATITATFAGDQSYKGCSKSYEITVTAKEDEPTNADVVFDFTSKNNWNIPSSGSNNTEEASFTDGKYTIKLSAANNYKMNDGYLILGKSESYLEFPAFDFDVEKIEVAGTSGASESVKQNIFVGETAVSTETTGAKNVTNVYEIANNYQDKGTIYRLVVTSSHNTQISKIYVYKKAISTSIQTVNTTAVADGAYFNLAGQRVAAPAKGLYIVNGKKVILK